MASENEMKIIFGADTAPLRAEVAKGADAIEDLSERINKTATEAAKGFDRLNKAANNLPGAFDAVVKSSVTLTRINKSISDAADAAEKGRKSFDLLGQTPLNNLPQLDAQIKAIKSTLAGGIEANIDTSGLSPRRFEELSASARELIQSLLDTISATQGLSTAFNAGLAEGIVQTLREAGISVTEFRQALAGLTTSGVNLTPLINILDQIEVETGQTTKAVKVLDTTLHQLSSGGPPPFPLPPIADITRYTDKIREIKSILASGVEADISNIKLDPSQFSTLEARVDAANGTVRKLGDTIQDVASKSAAQFNKISDSVQQVPEAINNINTTPLDRLRATIGDVGVEALKSGKSLETFVNSPRTDKLKQIDAELRTIKNTINSGFQLDKIKFTGQHFSVVARGANQASVAIGKLKSQSSSATLALTDISRVAQDLPYGFVGIANNINPLIDSFARLKRETGTTGGALKALAGSMIGVGGIGLAIGVVTAAIQIYQNGISGFNRKTKEAQDEFQEFLSSLRDAKTITAEAVGSVEAEIAKVSTLSGVIQDVNASTNERKRALEELQAVNKEYFGDLTLESAALGTLTKATDEYTKALVNQAIAKGFADELSKVAVELNKQEGILTRLQGQYQAQGKVTGQMLNNATKFGAAYQDVSKIAQKADVEEAFLKQRDLVEGLRSNLVGLKSNYSEALTEGLKFQNLSGPKTPKTGEDAQLKALKTQLDGVQDKLKIINELRKEGLLPKFREDEARDLELKVLDLLKSIDAREVQIKIKPSLEIDPQLNELQIQKVQNEANKKIAFTKMQAPLSLIIDTKAGAITKIQASANEALTKAGLTEYKIPSVEIGAIKLPAAGIDVSGGIAGIKKSAKALLEAQMEAAKFKVNVDIAAGQLGVSDQEFAATVKKFEELGFSAAEAYNLAVKEHLGKNILKTIGTGVNAAVLQIGEGLAAALTSGTEGLALAAEGFLSIIGGVLQEVGKQMILASTLVMALQKAIAQLFANPAAGLAVGIGLVVLGGILKNIKLAKAPKLAEGGIVRGPTLAMVGESGAEAIIPLNRANQFSGGSSEGYIAETRLQGRDILLMIRREIASQSRIGGLSLD